jgi:hypothetical protein
VIAGFIGDAKSAMVGLIKAMGFRTQSISPDARKARACLGTFQKILDWRPTRRDS